jgi:hypothetical protein
MRRGCPFVLPTDGVRFQFEASIVGLFCLYNLISSLLTLTHTPGVHNCEHRDDVGVCCANGCGVPDEKEGQETGAGEDGEEIAGEEGKELTQEEKDERAHPTMHYF